ncbi:MAG: HlyD family efflux transporter periplasmic adaptor subunit [Rhodothermales bacterium]|nr:HlyD family efflux transporter periplasmic adaptor subunit [Rhodothermales bacterium]
MRTLCKRARSGSAVETAACALLLLALNACSNGDDRADAYGNFEATQIIVAAEVGGRLNEFKVDEGAPLARGDTVGHIDTVQLTLQKSQFVAARRAVLSRLGEVAAHIALLEEQRRIARVEQERITRLLQDNAATRKQLDDADGQIAVIDRQVDQAKAQRTAIRSEAERFDAQIAQVDDQIRRANIVNPTDGTVLTKYAEASELVSAGRPLYKIADLSTMELRAYVSGAMLPHLRIGQDVEVQIDDSHTENRALRGVVSWISDESEFTPKLIQTKQERVNLVYAFKVRVPNPDGALKIGMPGEVRLGGAGGS